jgi:hypothetical protein
MTNGPGPHRGGRPRAEDSPTSLSRYLSRPITSHRDRSWTPGDSAGPVGGMLGE